jgi:hypothetical protein
MERLIVASSALSTSSIAKSVLLFEPVTDEQQKAKVPSRVAAVATAV